MIDIEKLVAQLKSFDALRGDDKINTGTVERIQPKYANDWPMNRSGNPGDPFV